MSESEALSQGRSAEPGPVPTHPGAPWLSHEAADEILSQLSFCTSGIGDMARYFLRAPGKRVRPALVRLSAALVGRPAHCLEEAAALVEVLHSGTLIHDDVIDHAHLRRGRPTLNRLWGDSAGILVGDYLLAQVMGLVCRIDTQEITEIASTVLASLVEGQWLELSHQADWTLDKETYFHIVRKKTAALIRGACEIGSVLAGATVAETESLARFGENLGVAFQVIDDCLDYDGACSDLGKDVGKDFEEGKVTLPLIVTIERAGDVECRRIRRALQSQDRQRHLAEVQAMVRKHGGLSEARLEAEHRTGRALHALKNFPCGPAREAMESLARHMLERRR